MDAQIKATANAAMNARSSTTVGGGADAALRHAAATGDDQALRDVAKAFETAFLAEMLKHAKLGEIESEFTGGYGEEAFRSFLVDEYAAAISESSDLGLADKLYADLKRKVAAYE